MAKTTAPNETGQKEFMNINIEEIVPYIDWMFFFHAWRITGKYKGIEAVCNCAACTAEWLDKFAPKQRPKAKEALKLYKDAQALLRRFRDNDIVRINATFSLFPAYSNEENIVVEMEKKQVVIPTLRQQLPSSDGFCYSLADFLREKDDFIGGFAVTVHGGEEFAKHYEAEGDDYTAILIKTLCDRLAEAATEWLHYRVRTKLWGFAPDEKFDLERMLKSDFQGIRPAVGYPSLPDLSVIFILKQFVNYDKIGISLTENGAMYPNASVSGLIFAHSKSRYFSIGKIDESQLQNYAQRMHRSVEATRKWVSANL